MANLVGSTRVISCGAFRDHLNECHVLGSHAIRFSRNSDCHEIQ